MGKLSPFLNSGSWISIGKYWCSTSAMTYPLLKSLRTFFVFPLRLNPSSHRQISRGNFDRGANSPRKTITFMIYFVCFTWFLNIFANNNFLFGVFFLGLSWCITFGSFCHFFKTDWDNEKHTLVKCILEFIFGPLQFSWIMNYRRQTEFSFYVFWTIKWQTNGLWACSAAFFWIDRTSRVINWRCKIW